jgi:hypothetical protein
MPTHNSNDTVFGGVNIFLQSKDGKTNENNSNCDFFLDRIIDSPRQDLGMLVSVLDAEIPYSFYNISDEIGNNKLTINSIEISIDEKNYSAFNIVDAFNEKFTTIQGLSITMSFDDNTNKFTLVSPTNFTINSTTMVKELGMDDLPQTTTTYISNKVCNLAGTSSIYIRSDNMNIQNINSFGKTNGVLAKVLVNSSPSNFIFFRPSTPQYFILGNSLNFINIQLLNDDNDFIDFNGLDWSITLSIEYFRKRDDTINYKYFLNSVDESFPRNETEQDVKETSKEEK